MASTTWSASEIHLVSRKNVETTGDRTFSGSALPATAVITGATLSGNAGSANGDNQVFYVKSSSGGTGTPVNKTNGAAFSVSVTPPSAGTSSRSYYFSFTATGNITSGDKHLYNLQLSIGWQNGRCTAPTSVAIDPAVGDVGWLSWSGAKGGDAGGNYGISGYQIQYRDSEDNTNWGDWTILATLSSTATYGGAAVDAPPTHGYYRQFRIRAICAAGSTYYSGWSSATATIRKTPTTAVSTPMASISAAVAESSADLSWTESDDGVNNEVNAYLIQYTDDDGSTWTDLETTDNETFTLAVDPPAARGSTRKFRVQAQGTAGSDFYSGWSNIVSLKKNLLPSDPGNLTSNLAVWNGIPIWESGNVVLTWSGSSDSDGFVASYAVTYQISDDGETWGSEISAGSANDTTISTAVPADLERGSYLRYLVRAVDNLGAVSAGSAILVIRRNTVPTAPTGLSISPVVFETGPILGTFTESTDETDEVDHYEFQYRTAQNYTEFGDYSSTPEAFSGSPLSRSPSLTRGYYLQYRIRAVDTLGAASEWAEFRYVRRNMVLGPPTNVTATPTWYENENVTVRWTAPSNPDYTLRSYEVYARTRATEQDEWSAMVLMSTPDRTARASTVSPPSAQRGAYVEFLVRAIDQFGIAGAFASVTVRKNRAPSTPGSLTVTPAVFETAYFHLTWTASTDPDGDVSGYLVGFASRDSETDVPETPDITYGAVYTSTSATVSFPNIDRGRYYFIAVQARDSKGVTSGWRFASPVRRNRVPSGYEFIAPGNNSTSFSSRPVIGIYVPAEPDGQSMIAQFRFVDASTNELEYSYNAPLPHYGGKFYFRIPHDFPEKNYKVKLTIADSINGTGAEISTTLRVSAVSWSREINSGTIISQDGSSQISHQADLTELRNRANSRRNYFGKTPRSAYTKTIGYFANWLDNVREIYNDMAEIYTMIGETIDPFPEQPTNAPTASTFNFVRELIENL